MAVLQLLAFNVAYPPKLRTEIPPPLSPKQLPFVFLKPEWLSDARQAWNWLVVLRNEDKDFNVHLAFTDGDRLDYASLHRGPFDSFPFRLERGPFVESDKQELIAFPKFFTIKTMWRDYGNYNIQISGRETGTYQEAVTVIKVDDTWKIALRVMDVQRAVWLIQCRDMGFSIKGISTSELSPFPPPKGMPKPTTFSHWAESLSTDSALSSPTQAK